MPERRRTRRADLWSLVTDRHLLRLARYTALCLTVGVVGYGGLQWLTDRWHPFTAFPLAIDGLVFAGLTLLLLVDAFTVRRNRQTVHAFLRAVERSPFAEAHIANSGLPEVLPLLFVSVGLLPGIVVAFSGLCRHWFLTYGGFATSATDFVSWLGYGVGWLLDSYSLNLTQAFDWHVSEIHATALVPRLLVFVFTVVIDVLAVRSIFTVLTSLRTRDL